MTYYRANQTTVHGHCLAFAMLFILKIHCLWENSSSRKLTFPKFHSSTEQTYFHKSHSSSSPCSRALELYLALNCISAYCTTPHRTVLHRTALYCTALHCAALHHTAAAHHRQHNETETSSHHVVLHLQIKVH